MQVGSNADRVRCRSVIRPSLLHRGKGTAAEKHASLSSLQTPEYLGDCEAPMIRDAHYRFISERGFNSQNQQRPAHGEVNGASQSKSIVV
jgi:hypothetical protein